MSNSGLGEAEYDRRYEGDYMDTDLYSAWARADLNVRQVVEMLKIVPDDIASVLDYGCGVGGWIRVLENVFPGAELSGVELSGNAVEKARSNFPRHSFRRLDGARSPFDVETFDMVFSYHVLEHVDNISDSVSDICRMIRPGGYACIIFPCGNKGSFLERSMRLIENSKEPSSTGELSYFFEIPDGHVRRLTSDETIALFANHGMQVVEQRFSGHFFGTVDWLARGTGPAYINRVFKQRKAKTSFGQLRLDVARQALLRLHRFLNYQSLDVQKRRNPIKQTGVHLLRSSAKLVSSIMTGLSSLEWSLFKRRPSGTAQYLVFRRK